MQADSTMTGWFPRRMLPSRTPIAHTVPRPSATTWTSTWRAAGPGRARAGGPRGYRNAGTLGKLPGPLLVAKQADDISARADERDALALAQPGKLRRVGDELPARPQGVGARLVQRRQQPYRVKAGAGRGECRRAEQHDLVGLPHDRRRCVLRAQGDRGYLFAGHQVQLGDRGNAAHGRFSAVDDGEPLHSRHVGSSVRPRRRG